MSFHLVRLFDGGATSAGITVSPEKAMTVPAVFACLQVLSQDIARTPIEFRRRIAEDTFVDAVDHDLWELLSSLPNSEMTSFNFKAAMQWSLARLRPRLRADRTR